MEFAQHAVDVGIQPITGAELTLLDGSHLTLLCESVAGYGNLSRLITEAHRLRGPVAAPAHVQAASNGDQANRDHGSPRGAPLPPSCPQRTGWTSDQGALEGLPYRDGSVGADGSVTGDRGPDDHRSGVPGAASAQAHERGRDESRGHGRMMPVEENTMTTARRPLIFALACLALVAVAMSRPSGHVDGMRAARASPVASPAVATNSARYLPSAEVIGLGWTLVATGPVDVDPAIFLDAATAVYVGPDGARAKVSVLTNLPGRAAVQRSWEFVGTVYDDARFEVTGPKDDGREEELAALPFPDGCVDVRRIDGTDPLYRLPGAMTVCAINPDVTVLVIVSGTVDGLTGHEASDRIATRASEAGA